MFFRVQSLLNSSSTQTSDASASGSTSRPNPTSSAKGSRHFPAGLIISAIVGSLALLGLLVGILYWLRRRSRSHSKHVSADTLSSTMELKPIPNEKPLPNSPITSPSYLQRQDLPVVANTPPAVPVASQSNRNTAIYHSDNRTIEEMAAKMQRMESEIVRLNHQMLPPAYPSPSNTQFG
ncbi:hypothetical protein C8J56DRAFT_211086 [Mycena floridula]|nr:hypothetical protein C8J56DRAFT_211086 [Mycena floridula]